MEIIRTGDFEVEVESNNIKSKIYASTDIHLERSALEELESFSTTDGIKHLSFTPDFHKGSGTPIGTVALIDRVYPNVVGSDIGCGMGLYATNLNINDINKESVTKSLKDSIRGAFFEGKRDIHIRSRNDLLAYGADLDNFYGDTFVTKSFNGHQQGQMGYGDVHNIFNQYVTNDSTRENFLGSIGGGNHFVELQVVDEVIDRKRAYEFGLRKGQIVLMVHSGSLDLGHLVSNYFKQKAKEEWIGKYPDNGYFWLNGQLSKEYLTASYNCANFAIVNRLMLANMLGKVLNTELTSVYDSPHNLVWDHGNGFLHRKGSCPASIDEPVMIPGSMGTRSAVCVGKSFSGTISSSSHGSGRILNRNSARVTQEIENINVITKIDFDNVRSDVSREVKKTLAEEAPRSYKDINQVINSINGAGIADTVAWLKPILTVKG